MDITTMAKCHRCTKEFMMGSETHYHKWNKKKPMVAGRCPWCDVVVSVVMNPYKIYPEHPVGKIITPIPYYEPEVTYEL